MTNQQLIDLEVENRALIETVRQMTEWEIGGRKSEMLEELEKGAQDIQQQTDQELQERKQ